MTPLTLLTMLAASTVAGAVLGACAAVAWRNEREPAQIARLKAQLSNLQQQLRAERARAWRAEHKLAIWIGFRDTTVIAIDRRGPQ